MGETYPRCAIFDDPPSPLTVVQKEISKHGWRPSSLGLAQMKWDAQYAALRSVERQLAAMEFTPTSTDTKPERAERE